jgi:hypothetical protein
MCTPDAVAIVKAFHRHLNDRNVQALLELATENVRIGGPRGSGEGKHLLDEWVARANIAITPTRWFRDGDTVVVEQQAVWRDPETAAETGSQFVASAFTIEHGQIASIARYGFLAEAVHSANMDQSNEIASPKPWEICERVCGLSPAGNGKTGKHAPRFASPPHVARKVFAVDLLAQRRIASDPCQAVGVDQHLRVSIGRTTCRRGDWRLRKRGLERSSQRQTRRPPQTQVEGLAA